MLLAIINKNLSWLLISRSTVEWYGRNNCLSNYLYSYNE